MTDTWAKMMLWERYKKGEITKETCEHFFELIEANERRRISTISDEERYDLRNYSYYNFKMTLIDIADLRKKKHMGHLKIDDSILPDEWNFLQIMAEAIASFSCDDEKAGFVTLPQLVGEDFDVYFYLTCSEYRPYYMKACGQFENPQRDCPVYDFEDDSSCISDISEKPGRNMETAEKMDVKTKDKIMDIIHKYYYAMMSLDNISKEKRALYNKRGNVMYTLKDCVHPAFCIPFIIPLSVC